MSQTSPTGPAGPIDVGVGTDPDVATGAAEPPDAGTTDAATTPEVVMTRFAEEMSITTAVAAQRRVRVSKRIVTETRTVTVEVQREELFVEELGVPDGDGTAEAVLPIEMILHEERLTTQRVVVPVERVRVTVGVVGGEVAVSAQLSSEQVALDDRPVAG